MLKRIFFDTETTGLEPVKCAIHQFAAIVEIDGKVVERVNLFIRPFEGALIEKTAFVNPKITKDTVLAYEMPDRDGYKEIKNLLTKYCDPFDKTDKILPIGYNVNFDKNFLSEMFKRNGDNFLFALLYGNHIDVLSQASEILEPERHKLVNFKLGTVARHLGLINSDTDLHDASVDIEITRKMFYILKNYNDPLF